MFILIGLVIWRIRLAIWCTISNLCIKACCIFIVIVDATITCHDLILFFTLPMLWFLAPIGLSFYRRLSTARRKTITFLLAMLFLDICREFYTIVWIQLILISWFRFITTALLMIRR